jgi:hypothetical protein
MWGANVDSDSLDETRQVVDGGGGFLPRPRQVAAPVVQEEEQQQHRDQRNMLLTILISGGCSIMIFLFCGGNIGDGSGCSGGSSAWKHMRVRRRRRF